MNEIMIIHELRIPMNPHESKKRSLLWWFFPWFLPTGDDAVRWCAAPKEGSLAWRLREDGGDVVRTTSLKDHTGF